MSSLRSRIVGQSLQLQLTSPKKAARPMDVVTWISELRTETVATLTQARDVLNLEPRANADVVQRINQLLERIEGHKL